jgi:hypothetical protein
MTNASNDRSPNHTVLLGAFPENYLGSCGNPLSREYQRKHRQSSSMPGLTQVEGLRSGNLRWLIVSRLYGVQQSPGKLCRRHKVQVN